MKAKEYRFRASQVSKIMTGNIGLTEKQQIKLNELQLRKKNAATGGDKPLTPIMEIALKELLEVKNNPELPKTMQSELREIWRMEKYNRNFPFTNKYIQKGIQQEEEAITLFQDYLDKVLGQKTLLTKNEERFMDDYFSGLPDLFDGKNKDIGYDTKCSFTLQSFPFPEDDLTQQYEDQNQVYMHLTGRKEWWTVYCLVNSTEHQLHNEKLKWLYAFNAPSEKDRFFEEMEEKQKDCEKMLVYDYERFVEQYPFHQMIITKSEWFGEGYDLPIKDRILIKKSIYNPERIAEMKERIELARTYLETLNGNNGRKNN